MTLTETYGKEYLEEFGALDYEPYRVIRTFVKNILPPMKILVISAPVSKRQTVTFQKRGDFAVFVDINKYAVKRGKNFGTVILSDANSLPFVDSSFDAVICRYLFEHYGIPEINKFLREFNRVTKKWCLIGVSTSNVRPERLNADPTHRTRLTFRDWSRVLNKSPYFKLVSENRGKELWLLQKENVNPLVNSF